MGIQGITDFLGVPGRGGLGEKREDTFWSHTEERSAPGRA